MKLRLWLGSCLGSTSKQLTAHSSSTADECPGKIAQLRSNDKGVQVGPADYGRPCGEWTGLCTVVLDASPEPITVFKLSTGKLLYANWASRRLQTVNGIAELFYLDPESLSEATFQVQRGQSWKGLIQVPQSLQKQRPSSLGNAANRKNCSPVVSGGLASLAAHSQENMPPAPVSATLRQALQLVAYPSLRLHTSSAAPKSLDDPSFGQTGHRMAAPARDRMRPLTPGHGSQSDAPKSQPLPVLGAMAHDGSALRRQVLCRNHSGTRLQAPCNLSASGAAAEMNAIDVITRARRAAAAAKAAALAAAAEAAEESAAGALAGAAGQWGARDGLAQASPTASSPVLPPATQYSSELYVVETSNAGEVQLQGNSLSVDLDLHLPLPPPPPPQQQRALQPPPQLSRLSRPPQHVSEAASPEAPESCVLATACQSSHESAQLVTIEDCEASALLAPAPSVHPIDRRSHSLELRRSTSSHTAPVRAALVAPMPAARADSDGRLSIAPGMPKFISETSTSPAEPPAKGISGAAVATVARNPSRSRHDGGQRSQSSTAPLQLSQQLLDALTTSAWGPRVSGLRHPPVLRASTAASLGDGASAGPSPSPQRSAGSQLNLGPSSAREHAQSGGGANQRQGPDQAPPAAATQPLHMPSRISGFSSGRWSTASDRTISEYSGYSHFEHSGALPADAGGGAVSSSAPPGRSGAGARLLGLASKVSAHTPRSRIKGQRSRQGMAPAGDATRQLSSGSGTIAAAVHALGTERSVSDRRLDADANELTATSGRVAAAEALGGGSGSCATLSVSGLRAKSCAAMGTAQPSFSSRFSQTTRPGEPLPPDVLGTIRSAGSSDSCREQLLWDGMFRNASVSLVTDPQPRRQQQDPSLATRGSMRSGCAAGTATSAGTPTATASELQESTPAMTPRNSVPGELSTQGCATPQLRPSGCNQFCADEAQPAGRGAESREAAAQNGSEQGDGSALTLAALPEHVVGGGPMEVECWHEVVVCGLRHPTTGEELIMVTQHDVSARVWAEQQLARVMEAEHMLLEAIFPQHVLEHVAIMAAGGGEGAEGDGATAAAGLLATMTKAACSPMATCGSLAFAPARPITGDTFLHLATSHSALTILFCDIQGFTSMCGVVKPATVMAFLNDLYTRLDAMLDAFGVYKVETIGDCYVAAGGLMRVDEETGAVTVRSDDVDPQHAHRTVQFAKALLRAASAVRLPHSGESVRLRVGIHSGPAMSGVVGTRMPRFCLFGDTINTASRMESTGQPGAIHVSQATRDLTPEEDWVPTGGVEAKGKGLMQTYLLQPKLKRTETLGLDGAK